jgi:hypothetical protein
MAQIWFRPTEHHERMGPYTAVQIQKMAADGVITPRSMISMDGQKWHRADKVKSLFKPKPVVVPTAVKPPDSSTFADSQPNEAGE